VKIKARPKPLIFQMVARAQRVWTVVYKNQRRRDPLAREFGLHKAVHDQWDGPAPARTRRRSRQIAFPYRM